MITKGVNLSDRIFTLVLYITVKKGYVNTGWLSHPFILSFYSIQVTCLHTLYLVPHKPVPSFVSW